MAVVVRRSWPAPNYGTEHAAMFDVLRADGANVHPMVETVDPPALILTWSDMKATPGNACFATVRPQVICVAGRITPEAGTDLLLQLERYVLARVDWPFETVTAPQILTVSSVDYLTSRITYSVPARLDRVDAGWPEPAPEL